MDDDALPSPEWLNELCGEGIAETRSSYDKADSNESGFKRLRVYQASLDLAEEVYRLTRPFPREELFGITKQIREAVVSAPLNIAEGWGRNGKVEFARFCDYARASLHEVDAAFDVSLRLEYVQKGDLTEMYRLLNGVSALLLKLAQTLRTK